MRYLKKWVVFLEDGTANATAAVSGSGDVSNPTVGNLPGVGDLDGSGDNSFYLKKKRSNKKGNPSQVTDMRDLAPAKGVTKVEEIKESDIYISMRPRDPAYDPKTLNMINDCLIELYDLDFELGIMDYDKQRHSIDLDDEETGYFTQEELKISLNKQVLQYWIGNYTIRCKFDDNGIKSSSFSTLRACGDKMDELEEELFNLVEEVSIKLINNLDYQSGEFTIQWLAPILSSTPQRYDRKKNVNVNIGFVLNNHIKS